MAVIMDGNGRWARERHLPRSLGHQRGRRAVRRLIESARRANISVLTLFAFSSENWTRPVEEVDALMRLFSYALERDINELHANGIRVQFIGDRTRLPQGICHSMTQAEELTSANDGMHLMIAVSYGGQWDILQAATHLARSAVQGTVNLDDETAVRACFEANLSTADHPPVDLFIRTGGEQRISNFLLWQSAYAELYFTSCLWPSFTDKDFKEALNWFAARQRRFGGVEE
ncbi:polyprenyl diphosphate synthase [Halothiobacillus sp. 15-55-196]|uniref:polyprenyl diphosphate synthase n=1 Tax=Halothiobacillus sp. 15-55-196 TaxID=1970382 RepID=UPI0025C5E66F|nr:polyprenyl diphosphate synthase [Halothiobacillus sp. 15-55-196]